jgi:hypothetical protein
LLRLVVVGPSVKHEELVAAPNESRSLDAVHLPTQLRREDRTFGELGPLGARKVGIQRSGSDSENLCFVGGISARKVEEELVAEGNDIRIDRVLPYKAAKDQDDEKHVHPLQLDVIERACVLWSNPGEVVLTPFMGVGSECYGAVLNGRKAIGIELKPSYYRQAVRNLKACKREEETGVLISEKTAEGMG